jgi:hypothetical protein
VRHQLAMLAVDVYPCNRSRNSSKVLHAAVLYHSYNKVEDAMAMLEDAASDINTLVCTISFLI